MKLPLSSTSGSNSTGSSAVTSGLISPRNIGENSERGRNISRSTGAVTSDMRPMWHNKNVQPSSPSPSPITTPSKIGSSTERATSGHGGKGVGEGEGKDQGSKSARTSKVKNSPDEEKTKKRGSALPNLFPKNSK